MKPAIIADNVTVTRAKKAILQNLTFEIKKGSLTGLIGPSGSGKTTLMRSIVGAQLISSGSLNIFGQKAGGANLRSRIGYVSQEPAVYSDLTVWQNLSYFAALLRQPKVKVQNVIEQLDLQAQTKQLVGSLSGGQRARVSLGVALLGDADLLVLDEPTVGLDPVLRESLWSLFAELAAQDKTLLISSHVMDEAARCQNILLIREGKLLWDNTRNALLQTAGETDIGKAFLTMIERSEHAR